MLRGGEFDPDRRRPDARADPGLANEAGEQQGGDDSDTFLVALSGMSSDVSGTGDGREGSVKMLSSPGGERMESRAKRIPLALKSSSRLNIKQSAELGRRPAQGDMRRKCRSLIDNENCDEGRSKRLRLVSMAREFWKLRRHGSAVLSLMTRRFTSVILRDSVRVWLQRV